MIVCGRFLILPPFRSTLACSFFFIIFFMFFQISDVNAFDEIKEENAQLEIEEAVVTLFIEHHYFMVMEILF